MVKEKILKRRLRHGRIRAKVFGTAKRPRLSVFRSLKYIYAQLINDEKGETLAMSSNVSKKMSPYEVGEDITKKASNLKISGVVFDRSGFKYHGKIKELAEGAKKAGLKF